MVTTVAHAEENLVDEDGLYEELVALAYGVRHVRTLGGAEFFHLPIGAIITQAEIDAAKASNLAASEAEWIQDGKENWAAGRAARWAGHVPTGALGSAHEAAKSAEAYAKNPAATKFKNLPSHHPFNLPTDHPRHVTPPASEAAALALDHQHHMVSGNPDTQFQPHPSSLTGPNEFTVGTEKYNVPAGSRLYQPKGLSNVRIVITPQEGVHAFTHVGEVDVPMDLQQAFADVLPPDAKNNDLYTTKKFDVAAEVSDSLKKSIQDTHDTKAAARYAAALVQNDHAMAQAPQPSGAPPVEPPAPMTAAEAGQHAVVTGALIHAHPGAELVDSSGETQFIKQPDGTWKHALFNATVDEATVQKLVSSGELHIKGAAPGLTHDFKAMSKDQWIAFLDKAPVGAKFQIDGKDIVKGPDKTWNGIASDKMGTLRLVANNYEDGTGPAIPKETPPSAWDQPVGFKESPVPTGPDQIPALQIRTGDKVNGDPVTKTFKTETPGRIRVVTQAADGTIQEHTWLKTTMIGVERADHGPSFDQKFPNASIKKTAEAGAPSPTPANDNLAKPEFQPYMPTSSVDGAKESHDGSGSGSTGGNQPAGGNVESAGSAGLPANDGGNGNAVAGPTGTTAGGVAGLGHPDGNGVGPGVVPPEIIKSELPQSDAIKAMAAKGLVTPQVVELDSQKGAQFFHDAIAALKEGNPYAASVYVHPVDEYKGMRLFLTHDGTSGFALDGNNAVSLFINPTSPHKGGSVAMLTMQTELGAQRLDAFDTKLPGIYAKAGYVPVARVHWNDQYAPEGWDKALYQNYNHGEPDVVFMVHDPAHSDGTYHPGEGKAFASYDQAEAFAKKAALDPSLANPANAAPGDVHHQPGEILSHQDLKNLPPGHTVEHTPSETKYSSQGQGKFLSHKSNAVGDISLMKTAADAGKIAYHSNNEKTAAEVKVAEAAANTAGKSPEPSGSGGQPSETAAAAVPTVEKKSGPSTKKASDLTKGDKIATGTIHLVTTYGAPKGKVTVYYHNNKGILTKAEWNKNTLIGYEAPKAEAPKVEAPKTPTPSTPEAAPAADHAGVQLWEGGPQFSQADVQAAHDALKNAGAFQVSYGFKSIPDNPLASMQAELKAEAKKQFPTMQPKAAVIKLLHNQLSPEQKAESKAEEVAKIHIGAKEPKPTQQGFNGGDYTAEEIQHAIQALEGDNGKLVKSILNKAGSPLGELSPITIPEVGFNKDKTITKQKFIDHLKSLLPAPEGKSTARPEKPVDTLGSIVPPTPEKSGRFKAVPKPEAPKFKARAQNQVDTLGSIIPPTPEKSGRFKAVAKPEALPHEPGTPLTGDQVKALPDGHVIAWHTFDGHSHPDMQHLGVIEGEHVLNDHGTKNSIDTLAAVADTHDPSASTPMKKNGVHYVGGPGTTKFSPSKYLPEANAGHGLYPGDKVTPEAHAKLAPGKYISNGKAEMHVLPDGTGIYVTSTGTTSKLSPAAIKKNHDAGMSNFLGNEHAVPEVVKKAPSAPGTTTKATVPVPTSKDLPNGAYFLKSKNGDVITVIGDQVSKNGEVIGDFKKLKLAFNKGQILDSNGTSITPEGYSGAVTLLNTQTTIPALLDLRQWLDNHSNPFDGHNYWSGIISTLSQAGFPISISSFVEAFNKNVVNPEDKINGGYYWLMDAAKPKDRQAMFDFLGSQIDALLSKVDTAIPEANTSALFDWTTDGYAKPPLQVVSIPQVGGYEAPSTLTAYAKQITEAFGAQKIFNLTHMGKYDKIDWINAVKAGNFAKAYNLEVAAHASKNKAHPSGFLHPGYEGNAATNHIHWAAAVEGEVPAGAKVDGNWSSPGVAASLAELDNFLITAHMQNPEWLTTAEKRKWVDAHRGGNKSFVDQLSAAAALKKQHGDPQVSPTPVWTDNVQPAKSYDQWFDNGPFPSTNDLYNSGTTAPSDYIHDHPSDPELQKSWDTWTSYYKNNYTSLSDMANSASWSVMRTFIGDHFSRLRNEWEAEDAKPKFAVTQEIAAGEHPTFIVSDHKGMQYIFKPVENGKDYRAEIEAAAVQLGALWGFTEPVASVQSLPTKDGGPLFDGKVGLLQSLIPNVGSLNQQEGSVDLSTLTPKQLGQIAAEHVLDWAIDNDDAHNENLLIKPDSTIVGIDKGRAFAAFGHWKGLAANSSMNTQATTVASDLFSKAKSGQLSPEQMDTAYLAAMKAAQKIQKSGDAAATSILEKGLANRPHYTQGPGSKEAVIQAFLDRKHAIVDQVGKMWQGIYDAAGRTKPEPPAKALGEEHQSGWHEKDLSTAVEDKMVWGAATIHSSPDIKHGQSLIWIEKNPNGDTITKGMFSINKYAEKKILSWMDSHLTSDTTSHGVISLADFPNMEPIRKALSTAGREVSDNLVSGVFNQDVMDHFQATKDQLLKDAQFADALPASAGQGTDKIDFPSGISVQPSALGQYRAAIDHYLTAANEVDQAKAEQRQTDKALFSLYHPIATKATPATYINPEKGLAYTELSSGDFITNKGSIVPASQLPDGATEGLNGWMAINGAQQSSGIQVVKEHAGDLAGNLKANGVKEQSNQFSTDGHSGQEYVVHLPTGEYIRFRNSDHTGTDLSQHSQFRFRLAGPDREASLSRVETVLNQMGIDMTGAEEDHAEDIYWREMFYRLVNSNGSGPTSQKDALQELRDLKPALATELGIPSDPYSGGPTISDNNLIDAVSASTTTVPDQHSFWHNLAVKAFGQARVDEFLGAGEHMPQYQHFDIATPEKTTGHAFWNRIDFTLKQILAKKTLIGQGTKGKDKSLANFIKSGNAISTEERLRTLGIFGHGISKTDDQPKGGANSVFTRVAYSGAKYEGSAGFGAHVIYWNPAVALQTGTMAFPSDSFGELAHQNYTPMSVLDALKHGGTDNELDVANAISVLDYMEIMIFNDSGNRNAAIQKFKELGHDILRGVPIEDRLIMRPELDHAMAIVMAAWGN